MIYTADHNHMVIWLASLLTLLLPFISAHSSEMLALDASLSTLLKGSKLDPGQMSLEVRQLSTGKVLFDRNRDLGLNPASSLKLLISITALSKLGPNHRFQTLVFKDGKNLCLKGGGDPSLVNETLWMLVQELRRKDLKTVEGDLIYDSSLFPTEKENGEDFEGDTHRAFTAPIAPLSLNFNSLTIHFEPTTLGKPALVHTEPIFPIQIINQTVTARQAVKGDAGAEIVEKEGAFVLKTWGKVAIGTPKTTIYRSIENPGLYTALVFRTLFEEGRGNIKGRVHSGSCSLQIDPVIAFESKPLSQIIFDMNKFSNNFIAEMLLRSVGEAHSKNAGLNEIRAWLKQNGIGAPELTIENASGLSRNTRISAHTLVSVLAKGATSFEVGPELMASLGIAGEDGTLRRRFKGNGANGRVRAKSGMLHDAVSLTGFADNPTYGTLAFSFIFHLPAARRGEAQILEEKLLERIVANDPK